MKNELAKQLVDESLAQESTNSYRDFDSFMNELNKKHVDLLETIRKKWDLTFTRLRDAADRYPISVQGFESMRASDEQMELEYSVALWPKLNDILAKDARLTNQGDATTKEIATEYLSRVSATDLSQHGITIANSSIGPSRGTTYPGEELLTLSIVITFGSN